MGVIRTILLVFFVIISILLILLVLVQNENNNGMGGVFGGQSAAFGSHSASVLTRTTGVFVGLFFVAVFTLALLGKGQVSDRGLGDTAASLQEEETSAGGSWVDADEEPPAELTVEAEPAPAEAVPADGDSPAEDGEAPAAPVEEE